MYNQFFGFRERPFRLVPDPDYLFLSKSHEEALAYLKYAVAEEEGFVEIIGEVGTGKTMLCRAFLENLAADTETAYIFNPKMNAKELLKAVNDEFGIPSHLEDTKSLIDVLNVFLMEKRAEGKKAILIIDEAQNLSTEVLEQIRLLSNLETTKNKLLQIILVGQPELGNLLDSYELRQLSQRISLSCYIKPLNFFETKEYIRHRIQVASQKTPPIFTRAAVRRIYKYSGGIPRLINIACDRSLLTAYGLNKEKVTGAIAAAAIAELVSREAKKNFAGRENVKRALALVCMSIFLGLVWLYRSDFTQLIYENANPVHKAKLTGKVQNPENRPLKKITTLSHAPPVQDAPADGLSDTRIFSADQQPTPIESLPLSLAEILQSEPPETSRITVMQTVLERWGVDPIIPPDLQYVQNDRIFFTLSSHQQGLMLEEIKGNIERIRNLNLCAILEFKVPDAHTTVYLTAVDATDHSMAFFGSQKDRRLVFEDEAIESYWTGRAYVFWKNFYNYQGIIPFDTQKESIVTLKLHLRDIGFDNVEINGVYDASTRMAVEAIQTKHGIPVDGYVGPLTKIALYNEKLSLPIPRLTAPMETLD
jgi:general secretion pathway protein A